MTQTLTKRRHANTQLQDGRVDVLVIGGGIVGAGVARDAAQRGLSVALVEQHDFASGTSSRSSRLLHGGIRYLAQGRVGLVREASVEKTVLHKIAPHLAQPLAFIFPTYRGTSWARWKMALGVRLYDWLCGRRNLGKSSVLSRAETTRRLPLVTTQGLTGAVRYYDGLTNDSRLVLDTLRSAAAAGATLHNYTRYAGGSALAEGWRCDIVDEITGARRQLTATTVINAAGPWSDRLENSRTKLRLTKGVHLVVDRRKLPVDDAVVVAEGDRILFVIPWGERLILGTTDTDYQGDLAHPQCDPEDIDYVLAATNAAFEGAQIKREDVLSTWAGLRPLVADSNGNPSDISRRHKIEMSHPGWWDVTGGKLTTYRLMAEETVDAVVKWLGEKEGEQLNAAPCRTAQEALLGESAAGVISGVLPPPVSQEIVNHCVEHEWALHLDDVMVRRTSWRYYQPGQASLAETVADWMGEALGWSDEERQEELARYYRLTDAAPPPPITVPHAKAKPTSSAVKIS